MSDTMIELPTLPLDLVRPFCSTDLIKGRWQASEPFVVEGWLYAGQHAVFVRVPAAGHPDSPAKNHPPVKGLFKSFPEPDLFTVPWPKRDEDSKQTTVGNHLLDTALVTLVAALPNVRRLSGSRRWDKPLPFIFDGGGQGLVMGLRKD